MHPEAPAPVRQRFHREAIVHFCRACVIYRHDRVMRQVHSHVSVEVRGRRCNYALSCCLQDERSHPQSQHTGVALQSASLPAHFDSRPQAQNMLCNETSTILAGWARQGVRVQPVPDLATISGLPPASCLEALGASEGCSKESSPPALVQISV